MPICGEGYIEITGDDGNIKRIGIERIHIEEDAGKLMHSGNENDNRSLVDFNRCGTPLLEIVSKPDINSPDEAYQYLNQIKTILKYIDVSNCNMEEGSLRCDSNISIKPKGEKKLGIRSELKNINSFKFIKKAIQYEVDRHREIIESGGRIVFETRLYDADKNITMPMRSKEEANDYRYFPEPDLLPVELSDEYIDKIKGSMPELPHEKIRRFIETYSIPLDDANILSESRELADYFEETVKYASSYPKKVSNWIMSEVMRILNEKSITIDKFSIEAKKLAELIVLIESDKISGKMGKIVFEKMLEVDKCAEEICKEMNFIQISDESQLEEVVNKVIIDNPKEVESYKSGKKGLIGFFVGQVMKETKGQANPKLVNELLNKNLNK